MAKSAKEKLKEQIKKAKAKEKEKAKQFAERERLKAKEAEIKAKIFKKLGVSTEKKTRPVFINPETGERITKKTEVETEKDFYIKGKGVVPRGTPLKTNEQKFDELARRYTSKVFAETHYNKRFANADFKLAFKSWKKEKGKKSAKDFPFDTYFRNFLSDKNEKETVFYSEVDIEEMDLFLDENFEILFNNEFYTKNDLLFYFRTLRQELAPQFRFYVGIKTDKKKKQQILRFDEENLKEFSENIENAEKIETYVYEEFEVFQKMTFNNIKVVFGS